MSALCAGRRMDTYGSSDLSVIRVLSAEAAKTVVRAFISSRLDYCNSLLFGVSDNLLRRLQAVQNATSRLVTGTRVTRRREHITPVLRQLQYWLPERQRIKFKLAVMVYKALNGHIWRILNASLPLLPADDEFDHPTLLSCEVPRTRTTLAIYSLLLDRVCTGNNLRTSLHLRDSELSLLSWSSTA